MTTPPIGLRWPPELYGLFQANAARLTHENPKRRQTVSSLAIEALTAYAIAQGWLPEEKPETEKAST